MGAYARGRPLFPKNTGQKSKESLAGAVVKSVGYEVKRAVIDPVGWAVFTGLNQVPFLPSRTAEAVVKGIHPNFPIPMSEREEGMMRAMAVRNAPHPTMNVARANEAQLAQMAQRFAEKRAGALAAVRVASMQRRPPIIPRRPGALFLRRAA
ncbi:Uncharacterised protein [Candidatus Norongarragalina meridionalis]|nr:Uncharacterised protein [Candidatus Norongarragalina meridionalis]